MTGIILTCDRTMASEYHGGTFFGFSACVPRGLIPDSVYFRIFCPPAKVDRMGRMIYAPLGLRRIEAALLDSGFDDVAVVHPDYIEKHLGEDTKLVAISSIDPLGIGPATTTFVSIFGGEAYMAYKLRELLSRIRRSGFNPRIVAGGPGAWQLTDPSVRRNLGIDHVVLGEGEKTIVRIAEIIYDGGDLPEIIIGETPDPDEIPPLRAPTINGLVEIARGCGRGCRFCAPTMRRLRSFPLDFVLRDVELNLKHGRNPLLHAEDVLRYGAKGSIPDREKVIKLFKEVKEAGAEKISVSHVALASVASCPELIEDISSLLNLGEHPQPFLGAQTGIETGSPRLMKEHMRGKCRPFKPEDWPDVVVRAFEILNENNWVPVGTIILGLPGERPEDTEATLDLVRRLREFKSMIVPLFFVSMGSLSSERSFTLEDLTQLHSELIFECWEHNFRWIPRLLDEYTSTLNPILRRAIMLVARLGIRKARKLIEECRERFSSDLRAYIMEKRGARARSIGLGSPIQSPIARG